MLNLTLSPSNSVHIPLVSSSASTSSDTLSDYPKNDGFNVYLPTPSSSSHSESEFKLSIPSVTDQLSEHTFATSSTEYTLKKCEIRRRLSCNECYRSWMHIKPEAYDFNDMFGDIDDLLPIKPKKATVQPVLKDEFTEKRATTKPIYLENRTIEKEKTHQSTLESKAQAESFFSDMESDEEETTSINQPRQASLKRRVITNEEEEEDVQDFIVKNLMLQKTNNRKSTAEKQKSAVNSSSFPTEKGKKSVISMIVEGASKKVETPASKITSKEDDSIKRKNSDSNSEEEEEYGSRKRRTMKKVSYFVSGDRNADEEDDDDYIEKTVQDEFSDEYESDFTQNEDELEPSQDKNKLASIHENYEEEEVNDSYDIFNPFILFNKEMRAKIYALHPNMLSSEVSKLIGQEWRNLDPEKKEAFIENAKGKAAEYKALTTGKEIPKPPPNVWIVYCKETVSKIREESPSTSSQQATKIAAQKWKELPEKEKDKYRKAAQDARDEFRRKYPDETKAFYDKMRKSLEKTIYKKKANTN
ncbi:hypothetical protein CU098_012906 [Rhizopus stolonifer]|uniref:HMG box domain-containing protein n=1 Tax=Rhizopus stolonifer TaxID=4846 RepID=A0A367KVF0_RHIST|nr:hypothetical protein CU098_012906 [Rhizopus stolonifer]